MYGPTWKALAVSALLGLGVLWAAAPAQAPGSGRAGDESAWTALADLALGLVGPGPPAQGPSAIGAHANAPEPFATPPGYVAQASAPPADKPQAAERPEGAAGQMADWVVASRDNGGRPFMIIDKLAADMFVFDADGRLKGKSPVLVGLARGDDSAPGVGDRDLSAVPPNERTTPAGRFVAFFGPAIGHRSVLWVDYTDAVALHPVVTANRKEQRLQRLRSPIPSDHRISYGCINVPADFYEDVVLKAFARGEVVYVLPDTKPLEEVFPAFARARASADPEGGAGDQQAR